MKICSLCKIEKQLECFAKKIKGVLGRQPHCKDCQKLKIREWYNKNTKTQKVRVKQYKKTVKLEFEQLKKHPCTDCKQSFEPIVMDWDHISGNKVTNVSNFSSDGAPHKALLEIAKCELVCANCHRIRTYKRRLLSSTG